MVSPKFKSITIDLMETRKRVDESKNVVHHHHQPPNMYFTFTSPV